MNSKFGTWRRLGLIVLAFVAVTATATAVRRASWTPIVTVGWLPAVVVALYSRPSGRCARRRGTTSAG
jgi:hypothetical protein